MTTLLFAVAALVAPTPAAPPALTLDLDDDGTIETATARPRGKAVRLEIASSSGKRLAFADAPAPSGSGEIAVLLQSGDIGSPGFLLEVVASRGGSECHSIWRFRQGALNRLPMKNGAETLPDCARPDGWTARWERKSDRKPADWVRERSRQTPHGVHTQRQVYAFAGFAMELDARRSSAEIAGVEIPKWNDAVLYPRAAIDVLASRFDLTAFRAAPRLQIRSNRDEGLFEVRLSDHAGEIRLPVVSAGPGPEPGEVKLTVAGKDGPGEMRVAVRDGVVSEVRVAALGAHWDALYVPASRFTGTSLEVYACAEDEISSNFLVGLWSSDKGEQLALNLLPGSLRFLEMRRSQVDVTLDPVPAGTDVLLVPRDGSPPAWAFALKGGNGLDRVPVRCGNQNAGAWSCETAGPAEPFHRVGGRMNAR